MPHSAFCDVRSGSTVNSEHFISNKFGLKLIFYSISKIFSGMANCVEPDQTATVLHCLHMPFCKKLRCSKF